MEQPVRHRRLYAFYQSKVLNAMMMTVVACLMAIPATDTLRLPVIAASTALLLFIAYSLWLWLARPSAIVINRRLSDINGIYTLYFIAVVAIEPAGHLWYTVPAASAVVVLFAMLVRPSDETFRI